MNAGYIPMDHWIHSEEGGGRIVGEACHIIDLFSYLVGYGVKACACASLKPKTSSLSSSDNKRIALEYEDGSVGTLEYFAVGSQELHKEWLEVHFDGKSIVVDDYKSILGHGFQVRKINTKVPDKGQLQEMVELAKYLGGEREGWPIDLCSILETTEIAMRIK